MRANEHSPGLAGTALEPVQVYLSTSVRGTGGERGPHQQPPPPINHSPHPHSSRRTLLRCPNLDSETRAGLLMEPLQDHGFEDPYVINIPRFQASIQASRLEVHAHMLKYLTDLTETWAVLTFPNQVTLNGVGAVETKKTSTMCFFHIWLGLFPFLTLEYKW